ncbi:MAG: FAD-dependent oxidoreductase [Actinomycetota bacterium]
MGAAGSGAVIDVAVVGGGPAGCAAAVTAAHCGMGVTLYTMPPWRRARMGESLPPGTVELVEDVFGAGAFREGDHLRSLGNRSMWGGAEMESADFMFNPLGSGWHLDRAAFDAALVDVVRQEGVNVAPGRPEGADFTIDATGRRAHVARSFGAKRIRLDRLVAMLWSEQDRGGSDATTTVEAAENGWWYTAPVSGHRRITAFMTDADLLPPPRERRGAIVTDASTGHLDRIAGERWLAVGDAAVSFDPLSSQGILASVLMGREAGRAVAAGDTTSYAGTYRALLHDHLVHQASYYGIERRWSNAPFWARRA